MCVYEVRRAPPDTVSGSAADKLTQVVDQLLGSVERLSNSCGGQGDDSRVRHRFRCSVLMETRDCMASIRSKATMKTAPRTGSSTKHAR
ncbi:hypothetical protein DPMN_125352 [Dreissena polymorpha]|uniref:Uncharacterized protein n=1 Tax=Dreissena polymorpha TaxID=45954 RepID=A0A9D4GXM7_DREPO|nr:hypothetical protein DPMN_125352 [Dreissena polymorpha]